MHDNPSVPSCLVEKLYRSAVGRDVANSEEPFLKYLYGRFEAARFRVPDLMRAIALSKTFYAVSKPPLDTAPRRVAEAATKGERQ
jgi:hypothetical protein